MTIVVATCNRHALLREAILSVAAQSCAPKRVVVVDDASERPVDAEELRSAAPALALDVLRHSERRGGPAAKNTGAAAAHTPLIAFLDDDDLLHCSYVERVTATFATEPSLEVLFVGVLPFGTGAVVKERLYGRVIPALIDDVRSSVVAPGVRVFERDLMRHLLWSVPIAFQRPVVRRDAFRRLGGYRPVRTWWDGELAIRAAALATTGLLEERLNLWRVDGQGFYTDADTLLRECEADVTIKERVLADLGGPGAPLPEAKLWCRQAAADARMEFARALLSTGQRRRSWQQWRHAMELDPSLRRARFALRLAAPVGRSLDPTETRAPAG
jgi:glycosyltransferase involved in cell wall biosynthesis